jgi:predicted RecB family endonuclease
LSYAFPNLNLRRPQGDHAETLFDAALPAFGFMPQGRAVTSFKRKTYSMTGHNLDRIFERDGVPYGAEIKNTLSYIDIREYRAKLQMCRVLGLKPLFIVRMAPKSYINETRRLGG